MTPETASIAIKECLKEIRRRLDQAAAIARAAEACADAGNTDQAITIVLDIEELNYEANTFLNAAALMKRSADL